MSKISDWQDGFPPCDGIWQIHVPEYDDSWGQCIYYAHFRNGKWGSGNGDLGVVDDSPYGPNNNPANPRKWRGVIDD